MPIISPTSPGKVTDPESIEQGAIVNIDMLTGGIIVGGGGTPEFRWIRVDGGQVLNAAPEVTGIKGAPIPATVPADLDPGVVDSAGVETTAPIGTFPDGVGYGTLYGSDGTVIGRRLVRLEGTTVLSGWTFYAAGNVTIDDDAIWIGSKTFMVINNA